METRDVSDQTTAAAPCPTPQSGERQAVAEAPPRSSDGVTRWVSIGISALAVVLSVLGAIVTSAGMRGEQQAEVRALKADTVQIKADLTQHASAPNHSGGAALSERLAVVETKVGAILESVARIEQAQRDDRAERRSGGPR